MVCHEQFDLLIDDEVEWCNSTLVYIKTVLKRLGCTKLYSVSRGEDVGYYWKVDIKRGL